jgi:hypothetical protein
MSEEVFGVFFRDQNEAEYLVAVEGSEEDALEEAQRRDERAYQLAMEEGVALAPTWEEFDGLHYVESVSAGLAADAREQLARGFAVRVE